MGTRICKAVGYGVLQPKIDWDRWHERLESHYSDTLQQFYDWLLRHKEEVAALYAVECPEGSPMALLEEQIEGIRMVLDLNVGVIYPRAQVIGEEHHRKAPFILFTPPTSDWIRRDDTLDWVEETLEHKKKPRLREIPGTGIPPYGGYLIRYRKPKNSFRLDPEKTCLKRGPDWYGNCFDDLSPTRLCELTHKHLLAFAVQKPAFLRHLQRDYRPPIPFSIVAMVLWLDIVDDPRALLDQFRPIQYTAWE
jgi:hypothetical protein